MSAFGWFSAIGLPASGGFTHLWRAEKAKARRATYVELDRRGGPAADLFGKNQAIDVNYHPIAANKADDAGTLF